MLAAHSFLVSALGPGTLRRHGYSGVFVEMDASRPVPPELDGAAITCVGVPFETAVEPERVVELAQRVEAPAVRIWGASMAGRSYANAYQTTLERCKTYHLAARKHGIRVLLHQRWGTVTTSASQILRVLEQFDPREVGCIYDAGSMTIEGYEEYRIGLEVLGDYVADVHLANTRHFPSQNDAVWDWEWSPLDDGVMDLQRLVRALRRVNYQGWLTVADRCPGPASTALLEDDARMVHQALNDLEGIGSHNPFRPLDDHVALSERPERT